MKRQYLIPVIAAFLIIIALLCWIFNIGTTEQLKQKSNEIKSTHQKIDSVSQERNEQITDFTKRSESDSKTSIKIIKSIQYEKPIIRDTTYDAMCKYIENYRPE